MVDETQKETLFKNNRNNETLNADLMEWQQNCYKRARDESNEHLSIISKKSATTGILSESVNQKMSQSQIQNAIENDKAMTVYSANAKGPYSILVKYREFSNKPLNIYSIGKIVHNLYRSVIEVKKDGRFRGQVIFRDRDEPNLSLTDGKFGLHGLYTYIPSNKQSRKGVIKNIPTDLSDMELKSALKSDIAISQVTRLNKKSNDKENLQGNSLWIPTTSVLVHFEGNTLPKVVSLYHVLTNVTPFVKKNSAVLEVL
ncbi:hypothetical protein TKK_0010170 [Trichogramma kaykai]